MRLRHKLNFDHAFATTWSTLRKFSLHWVKFQILKIRAILCTFCAFCKRTLCTCTFLHIFANYCTFQLLLCILRICTIGVFCTICVILRVFSYSGGKCINIKLLKFFESYLWILVYFGLKRGLWWLLSKSGTTADLSRGNNVLKR